METAAAQIADSEGGVLGVFRRIYYSWKNGATRLELAGCVLPLNPNWPWSFPLCYILYLGWSGNSSLSPCAG